MSRHVDAGELPGLVALVWQRGAEVATIVLGAQAFGGPPMRRDTIFRITSMTKPVVAAAALSLIEEGRLRLDDPVDPLLPELANRRVLRRLDGPLHETVPALRPITLRDLLTFRMGFGMVWPPDADTPIRKAADELGLVALGAPNPDAQPAPDEWIRRFGTLPLMAQPGERWMYNTSAQVLGVLLARVAARPLDVVLRERIFEPLGMKDTSFFVGPEKRARFATAYQIDGKKIWDAPDGQWSHAPAFASGDAGLCSTADDFLAFGRMLLEGGGRVLSRALRSRR